MKIMQINSHINQGGAGKIVACIHKELIARGHSSLVAYGRGKDTNEQGTYRIGSRFEVAFEGIVTRLLGINGFTSWKATSDLVREINRFGPDVLHLHGLHGYYLNYEILFRFINKNSIPCVWTFHDCHAFSGNCGYHYDCEKWISGCNNCDHLREYPRSNWFDFTKFLWIRKKELFTKTDNKIIVSPSDWMTNDAKGSFFGKYRCITINNGIDTDHVFYRRDREECRLKHGFAQDDNIVLAIAFGFNDPRKGVKYILQTAHDLKMRNIKFVIIGWNERNSSLIEGLDNVRTLPFTNNQDELAEYYSLSDVFVLPSLAENYATVILEAMACGVPVVGFNVGGVAEQVSDGRGIKVSVGNQSELSAAVVSIIDKTANISSNEEIASYTKKNNSISLMVDKYIGTYSAAMKIEGRQS